MRSSAGNRVWDEYDGGLTDPAEIKHQGRRGYVLMTRYELYRSREEAARLEEDVTCRMMVNYLKYQKISVQCTHPACSPRTARDVLASRSVFREGASLFPHKSTIATGRQRA